MAPLYPLPMADPGNGEYIPARPTREQRRVAALTLDLAGRLGRPHGLSRRAFLRTASGLAAAFLAMNTVYGDYFGVAPAEAADPAEAGRRAATLADQPVIDAQLHYVHDRFDFQGLLDLRSLAAREWNPAIRGEKTNFEKLQFKNFLDEVYLQSDTKIGLLSGAPSDTPNRWFLTNDQLAKTRRVINDLAGSRRLLTHAVITPGQPGWLEEMDRCIEVLKPDSWKGYTVGDPLDVSAFPYRLDDEKLMYPAYQRMVDSGITTFCVHKGLVPADPKDYAPWPFAKVDDLPRAAQDWPQIKFVIYHSALQPMGEYSAEHLRKFEETGRIDWVSDLAEIPAKHGVKNVYGEVGSSFASSCIAHPRHAAALLGILIKGLGPERVIWGTDSVWYGSPQWQIEAFRRIEIPEDLRRRFGYEPLGGPESPVKQALMTLNSARMYGLDAAALQAWRGDAIQRAKADPARARALLDQAQAAMEG